MVVSLGYLSLVHLHRTYYDYGSYTLDITGPLMVWQCAFTGPPVHSWVLCLLCLKSFILSKVITQKVTLLTFSIHDGFARNENELTKSQQFHAIRTLPTALEFFSYLLHFQGLMAGPLVFYKDYIDFIEGTQFLKQNNGNVSWFVSWIYWKRKQLRIFFWNDWEFLFICCYFLCLCCCNCCMLSQHLTKVVIKLWSNHHQQRQ